MPPVLPTMPGVMDFQVTLLWASLFGWGAYRGYMYLRPGAPRRDAQRLAVMVGLVEFVLFADLLSLPLP